MNTHQVTCYAGSRNITEFPIVDSDSVPSVNFENMLAPVVGVEVHNPNGADWVITSATDDVTFENNVIKVKFGQLNLPTGKYYPKIYYTEHIDREPFVLAGRRKKTEVLLHAYE